MDIQEWQGPDMVLDLEATSSRPMDKEALLQTLERNDSSICIHKSKAIVDSFVICVVNQEVRSLLLFAVKTLVTIKHQPACHYLVI